MEAGRNAKGRFEKGNSFGTGRRVSELRKAFVEAVTPEDVREMVAAIVGRAKQGDIRAAQIVLPYIVGSPMKSEEVRREIRIDETPPFESNEMFTV